MRTLWTVPKASKASPSISSSALKERLPTKRTAEGGEVEAASPKDFSRLDMLRSGRDSPSAPKSIGSSPSLALELLCLINTAGEEEGNLLAAVVSVVFPATEACLWSAFSARRVPAPHTRRIWCMLYGRFSRGYSSY